MGLLQSPTLQRLILEARIFLNELNPTNSFWSDQELGIYANDAVRQYFLVVNDQAEGQFDTSVLLDVVQDQELVPLPNDFFEVRAVYSVQPNQNVMLRYYNNVSEGFVTSNANTSTTYAPYYYFRDGGLVLRPIPSFSGTGQLLLEYTQFPQTMIVGGDQMSSGISPIFKELVVKYICYQAKLKESSVRGGDTYLPVERQLSSLFAQFKLTVGGRSKYPQFIKPFEP